MYRFLLKPKWIAFTLLVALLVVVMVNLAFWQLRRLHQREAFNDLVRANANQPIAPIADVLTPGVDPHDVEWRRVSVTGTYLPDQQVVEVNRSQDGQAGSNAIDPLADSDGSVLIVNRGFVPDTVAIPSAPTGTVTLIGQLRRSESRGLGETSDPSGVVLDEVHRIDIPKLTAQFGGDVEPMYLQLLQSDPARGSVPGERRPARPRRWPASQLHDPVVHLQHLRDRRLGAGGAPCRGHPSRDAQAASGSATNRRRAVARLGSAAWAASTSST